MVLIGLTGIAFTSLGVGLSSSLWQMLACRALAGGLTANIACVYHSKVGRKWFTLLSYLVKHRPDCPLRFNR